MLEVRRASCARRGVCDAAHFRLGTRVLRRRPSGASRAGEEMASEGCDGSLPAAPLRATFGASDDSGALRVRLPSSSALLSIFRHAFRFACLPVDFPRRLWHSVRQELRKAAVLLLYAEADLSLITNPAVFCSDSSGFAWAANEAMWPVADVDHALKWSERWRWRHGAGWAPREHALEECTGSEGEGALVYPEVSRECLVNHEWQSLQVARRQSTHEPIHLKEFCATLGGQAFGSVVAEPGDASFVLDRQSGKRPCL